MEETGELSQLALEGRLGREDGQGLDAGVGASWPFLGSRLGLGGHSAGGLRPGGPRV